MDAWAGRLAIGAVTPDPINGIDIDYEQNLAGVQAILRRPEDFMPLPEDHQEQGITVPALIWRYWQAHGGTEQFGPPLAPATSVSGTVRQFFARAVLELHPDQADTPYLVQPAPL